MIDTYTKLPRNVVHVVPVDDLVEHKNTGFGCVCGPKVQYERHWDGCCEDGWVVVHHALDGRA